MTLDNTITNTLAMTKDLLDSPEMTDVVRSAAKLAVTYYQALCDNGLSEQDAITITTSFAASGIGTGGK